MKCEWIAVLTNGWLVWKVEDSHQKEEFPINGRSINRAPNAGRARLIEFSHAQLGWLMIEHNGGEGSNKCDQCDNTSTYSPDLRNHKKREHEEKRGELASN